MNAEKRNELIEHCEILTQDYSLDFIIAEEINAQNLAWCVNYLIGKGYKPHGSMVSTIAIDDGAVHEGYFQPMTRTARK